MAIKTKEPLEALVPIGKSYSDSNRQEAKINAQPSIIAKALTPLIRLNPRMPMPIAVMKEQTILAAFSLLITSSSSISQCDTR